MRGAVRSPSPNARRGELPPPWRHECERGTKPPPKALGITYKNAARRNGASGRTGATRHQTARKGANSRFMVKVDK